MKQARGLIIEKKKKENVLSIKGPYGGKHCWVNEDLVDDDFFISIQHFLYIVDDALD